MFGFFESQDKKMRVNASNWLELASKVWSYRRDELGEKEAGELRGRAEDLRRLVKERADAGRLRLAIDSLEGVLVRTGGAIYPKTSLAENVEFFLVAAIVILGIRTYFVQPFKIPTNSMWPTYYGMTAENLPPSAPAPNIAGQLFRFLAYGAERHTLVAPRDGPISVPLFTNGDLVSLAYTLKAGRSWLVFPARFREYTFYVGGQPVSVRVPDDFSKFDDIFFDTFFPDRAALLERVRRAQASGEAETMLVRLDEAKDDLYRAERIPIGRDARAGETLLRFDILAGDQLFVDRVSFNFVRPRVGQGFVFRTDNIPDIARLYGDQYYIKRLIGVPGDRIEVRDPVIYRNGSPITGSVAFDMNARLVSPYLGYSNASRDDPRYSMLYPGQTITVPDHGYLAMGDNSHDSFDGRFWGYVPEKDVVGRPLFIYFPFTRRWGTAK
jgi:signal peptidase I